MIKLIKPRYEYYKGTTEVVDNELDNFVEDAVDRLNEQHSIIKELVKVKQIDDEQIIKLKYQLEVEKRAFDNLYEKFEVVAFEYAKMDIVPSKSHFKEQTKNK